MNILRYQLNEIDMYIRDLEHQVSTTVDQIVDNMDDYPEDVLDDLQALLEEKEYLLIELLDFEKNKIVNNKIVDLKQYKNLISNAEAKS